MNILFTMEQQTLVGLCWCNYSAWIVFLPPWNHIFECSLWRTEEPPQIGIRKWSWCENCFQSGSLQEEVWNHEQRSLISTLENFLWLDFQYLLKFPFEFLLTFPWSEQPIWTLFVSSFYWQFCWRHHSVVARQPKQKEWVYLSKNKHPKCPDSICILWCRQLWSQLLELLV